MTLLSSPAPVLPVRSTRQARLPGRLVTHLRRYAGATALITPGAERDRLTYAELADRVDAEAATYRGSRRLVLLEGRSDVDGIVAYLGALAADQAVVLAGDSAIEGLAAAYDPDVVVAARARRDVREQTGHELHPDLTLLLSTSGSTGSPKLVRLCAESLLANAESIVEALGVRATDVAATTLPLHYCYGLSVLHSHLLVGASLLLTQRSVLDEEFWADVATYSVTTFPGVPHTYDLLERSGFADRDVPSLRYLTQAGGRMAPERVGELVALGRRKGFDLVVMYGQTEATARIAVLPPDLAEVAPGAIGRPVPGGRLSLRPVPGAEEGTGELVYEGPNVMLGYAETPVDLALGRTTDELATGDLGRLRSDGLWEIVGRRGRAAKVLGLRLDLDRVERLLAARGVVVSAVDGGERLVLGVTDQASRVDAGAVRRLACEELGLPATAVDVVVRPELPRLTSGKVDARALAALAAGAATEKPVGETATLAQVVDLYAHALGRRAGPDDTFVALGGDSLSYVEVSLRLERLLGHLPADWPTVTVAALASAPRSPARRGRHVETNVVLRALAIVSIVGTHANLFVLLGGAHLLLAVAGFNVARFQLTAAGRAERARSLLRTAARFAAPSMLVIAVVSLWTEGLGWRQALLVNGVTSWGWSEPGWHYWFVEAVVALVLTVAALAAVPAFDRLERGHPFWLPFALVVAGLLTRYGIVGIPGDNAHRAHVLFWLFALGWAAARAARWKHRALLSIVALVSLPGFFEEGGLSRDAYVAAGLLVLIWLPAVRLPGVVARSVGVLAGASLWIYLLHWQVYPHLEASQPWLAAGLSLAVGVAAWWTVARAGAAWRRRVGNR